MCVWRKEVMYGESGMQIRVLLRNRVVPTDSIITKIFFTFYVGSHDESGTIMRVGIRLIMYFESLLNVKQYSKWTDLDLVNL